jgi:hypothetical protein
MRLLHYSRGRLCGLPEHVVLGAPILRGSASVAVDPRRLAPRRCLVNQGIRHGLAAGRLACRPTSNAKGAGSALRYAPSPAFPFMCVLLALNRAWLPSLSAIGSTTPGTLGVRRNRSSLSVGTVCIGGATSTTPESFAE